MPPTTIPAMLPGKAATQAGASDGQSFSSVLGGSQVQFAASAPEPTMGGRSVTPGGKPGSESAAHKGNSLKTAASLQTTKVATAVQQQAVVLPMPVAPNAALTPTQPGPAKSGADSVETGDSSSLEALSAISALIGGPGTQSTGTAMALATTQVAREQAQPPIAIQAQPAASIQTQPAVDAQTSSAQAQQQLRAPQAQPAMADQVQPSLPAQALPVLTAPQASSASSAFDADLLKAPQIPAVAPTRSGSQTGQAGTQSALPAPPTPSAAALKALIAPLLTDAAPGLPSAPEEAPSGVAALPLRPAYTETGTAPLKRTTGAENVATVSTQKSPVHGAMSSDPGENSKAPVQLPTGNPNPLAATAKVLYTAASQAPGTPSAQLTSSSASDAALGSQAGVIVNPVAPTQDNALNGDLVTQTSGHHDKPRDSASGIISGGQGGGSSAVTAAGPVLAKATEIQAGGAGAGSLRDSNTPIGTPPQAPAPVPEPNRNQSTGTAATNGNSLPDSGLNDLTQARVLHSLSGSEMHINLNSEEFGRVSVHAAYGRDSITTQISLENTAMGNALGSALNAHLSTLETKLGQEHGVASSVTLGTQSSSNHSASQGSSSDPHSQSRHFAGSGQQNQGASAAPSSFLSPDAALFAGQSTPALTEASSGRLDIRI